MVWEAGGEWYGEAGCELYGRLAVSGWLGMPVALARAQRRRRTNGTDDAPFTPGRRKRLAKPHAPGNASAACAASSSATGEAAGKAAGQAAGDGWETLRRAVTLGRFVDRMAVPSRKNVDEERTHKQAGSAISSDAVSTRWDVQNMYRQLYFPQTSQRGEEDPWGQMDEWNADGKVVGHRDDPSRRKARNYDRLTMLSTVKRKLKRELVDLLGEGADWEALFYYYDTDGSGGIGFAELQSCFRCDANITEHQLSDVELKQLFQHLTGGSREMSLKQFVEFMETPTNSRSLLPVSGNVRRTTHTQAGSTDTDAQTQNDRKHGWLQQFRRTLSEYQPFVAEYITHERVPLRAECDLDSQVVGFLEKGEIVAVTHVWNTNELKCHRLRWNDSQKNMPLEGWTSHRGKLNPTEGTSVLLSRLSRDEWSMAYGHRTSIAERVSVLKTRAKLAKQLHRASKTSTTGGVSNSRSSQRTVDKSDQKDALNEHHHTMRVYASIDRALVLHRIAASKLECRMIQDAADKHKSVAPTVTTGQWPVPRLIRVADDAATGSQPPSTGVPPATSGADVADNYTSEPPTVTSEQWHVPPSNRAADSVALRSKSASADIPQAAADGDVSGGSIRPAVPPISRPALTCGNSACADSSILLESSANYSCRKPTPPCSARGVRCSSPPPRAGRSCRLHNRG